MDDLTVAKACAKALGMKPVEDFDKQFYLCEDGITLILQDRFDPLTDPAIAFRLVGWLVERGLLIISDDFVALQPYGNAWLADRPKIEEPYITPESRCAAVAKLVARVMEGQG